MVAWWLAARSQVCLYQKWMVVPVKTAEPASKVKTEQPREVPVAEILAAEDWKYIYWQPCVVYRGVFYGSAASLQGAIQLAIQELSVSREQLRRPGRDPTTPTPATIAQVAGRVGLHEDAAKSWSQFVFCAGVCQSLVPTDLQGLGPPSTPLAGPSSGSA